MVFGIEKLKNELEGALEERDYFRSKYLEQISVIASLQEELKNSRKEISRLRAEVMGTHHNNSSPRHEEKKEEELATPRRSLSREISDLTKDCEEDEEEEEVDIDEKEAIRESASKLLQWASYRESFCSPERSRSPTNRSESVDEQEDELPVLPTQGEAQHSSAASSSSAHDESDQSESSSYEE